MGIIKIKSDIPLNNKKMRPNLNKSDSDSKLNTLFED